MSAAVCGYDLRCDNLSILHVIELKLLGVPKVLEDFTVFVSDCDSHPSLKIQNDYQGFNWEKFIESRKASVRCKVEHAFLIVKRDFGYKKVVYKGIKKNLNRFHILLASANLLMLVRGGRTEEFCNA